MSGEFSGEPLAISWSAGSPKVLNSLYYINNTWSNTFQISDNSNDITNARITWNDTYKNFLTAYTNEDQGELESLGRGLPISTKSTPEVQLLAAPPLLSYQVFNPIGHIKLLQRVI